MGGLIKLVVGVAIGAGVAVAATKLMQRNQVDGVALATDEEPASGLKERLRLASEAARAARADREAELQAFFRRRVEDPMAFTPTAEDPVP